MKKTYMQPAMLVVKTNVAKMICVSGFSDALGKSGGEANSNTVLSKRRRGIFQDDASEEDQSIW